MKQLKLLSKKVKQNGTVRFQATLKHLYVMVMKSVQMMKLMQGTTSSMLHLKTSRAL